MLIALPQIVFTPTPPPLNEPQMPNPIQRQTGSGDPVRQRTTHPAQRDNVVPQKSMIRPAPMTNERAQKIRAEKARQAAFVLSLQGPRPDPAMHSRCDILEQDVVPVVGAEIPLLRTTNTPPDGNCLFHAFAKVIGRETQTHLKIREVVVQYMRRNWEDFIRFNPDRGLYEDEAVAWKAYLAKMARPGEFGDQLEIQAFCRAYRVKLSILKRDVGGKRLRWTHHKDCPGAEQSFWLFNENEHYENLVSPEMFLTEA